jgi:hypothetical protein
MPKFVVPVVSLATIAVLVFVLVRFLGPAIPIPGASPGSTAAATGELAFEITWKWDNTAVEKDLWAAGEFSVKGDFSRAFLETLDSATTPVFNDAIGLTKTTWPASGSQRFSDARCETEDQCLSYCVLGSKSEWLEEPTVSRVGSSNWPNSISVHIRFHPLPPTGAGTITGTDGACDIHVSGPTDTFPPMVLTITNPTTSLPSYTVEHSPDSGSAPIRAGEIFDVTVAGR